MGDVCKKLDLKIFTFLRKSAPIIMYCRSTCLYKCIGKCMFNLNSTYFHIVPVAILEALRALKLSRLENLRALKFIAQIGRF